jgi:hypothetical protein
VELFLQGPEMKLEVSSPGVLCQFLYLAGFYSPGVNPSGEWLQQVQAARRDGKLFPPPPDMTFNAFAHALILSKARVPMHGTRLVQADTQQPSFVNFNLQNKPMTWEALIQESPLLTRLAPLPPFITKDLSAFLKKDTAAIA